MATMNQQRLALRELDHAREPVRWIKRGLWTAGISWLLVFSIWVGVIIWAVFTAGDHTDAAAEWDVPLVFPLSLGGMGIWYIVEDLLVPALTTLRKAQDHYDDVLFEDNE